jgi:dipeptidyl aminopeptidase/acylaminoacyl peptidase
MKKAFVIIAIIVVLLLLPLIFNDRSQTGMIGPDLSELQYSEIVFDNEVENIPLAGMLFLPEGEGPFPTAVVIHGSGPSRRNSVWYLSVAKHLQDNGIAVLLPDKRGCEKSGGEWVGADFEKLATDATSAAKFVKYQNSFSPSVIGLIGMSQGGWIAPVAATITEDVSFVASVSGAAVTTDEQLLHEEVNNIAPYTYKFIARMIAPITSNMIKKREYFVPFVGFDPIPYWKRIDVPVFMGYGENDKNVPVDECVKRLKENGLHHFKIKTYPQGGHAIVDVDTREMNKDYLNDLIKFIKEVVSQGGSIE